MCVVRPVVCVSTAFLLEGRAFTMFVVLIVSRVDAPRFWEKGGGFLLGSLLDELNFVHLLVPTTMPAHSIKF